MLDKRDMLNSDREYFEGTGTDPLPLLVKERLNQFLDQYKGNVTPDTIGADYFFVEGFLTLDMDRDFAGIQRDFLKKCYSKLKDFRIQTWYGDDYVDDTTPQDAARKKVLTYMYNGAKSGDEYCLDLIKYLHKTYYKKEYNQLKRFRTITAEEIMSLAGKEDGLPVVEDMGRILGMCSFFHIEMQESCSALYRLLERVRECQLKERNELFEKVDAEEIEELLASSEEQVDQWRLQLSKQKLRRCDKIRMQAEAFIERYLNRLGFPKDYIYRSLPARSSRVQWSETLSVLKEVQPEKEFTPADVEIYSYIALAIESLVDICQQFQNELNMFYGEETDWGREEDSLFDPSKIQVNTAAKTLEKEKTVIANVAPVKMGETKDEEYLEEIAALRKKLNEKEQENRQLRELYRSVKSGKEDHDKLLADFENQREELIALRDYAYRSSKGFEEQPQETIEDMKEKIAKKDVVIIGGHINWINKLQKQFPKWIIVPANASQTIDQKIMNGKDKAYFFTDHLDHVTYGKYIAICREKRIPFGYLHGVNIETMIQQVYEDLCE